MLAANVLVMLAAAFSSVSEPFPGFSRLPALLRNRPLYQRREHYHRASPVFCVPKCGLCSPHRPSPALHASGQQRRESPQVPNERGKPCCERKPGAHRGAFLSWVDGQERWRKRRNARRCVWSRSPSEKKWRDARFSIPYGSSMVVSCLAPKAEGSTVPSDTAGCARG